MVIQLELLEAVRAQLLALAVMAIVPSPFRYDTLALVGDNMKEHAANEGDIAAMQIRSRESIC